MASYRDLLVWRKAMDLADGAYALGKLMPKAEQFRLTAQLLPNFCAQRYRFPPISPKVALARGSANFCIFSASRVGPWRRPRPY